MSFILGLLVAMVGAAIGLAAARLFVTVRPAERDAAPAAAIGLAGAIGFLLLFQNVLVHDALWYYGYLRSAIVQGDLDLYDEFVLRNPHGMYLPPPEAPLFHLGTSILQAPLALLVRPLALLLGRAGIVPGGDGYGPLETFAAAFASMLLAIGGIALTHRLACRVTTAGASAVAQVTLLFASPLAFFAFVWPGYPHPATVFLAALFLLLWSVEGERRPFLLGLIGGALALVHPQDIVYLALPALDAINDATVRARGGGGRAALGSLLRSGARLAAGALLGFAPQLAAWRATSGRFLPHVYGEIGDPFRWGQPAFVEVLLSAYNGLLTWTPLCGLALAGLFLLRRGQARLFRGLAIVFALEWWAIASYGYWWGGASFGARYFLSAWPVLGVGLAAAAGWLQRRIGLRAAGVLAAPFVYWNLLLMAQFRLEWIPHNHPPDLGEVLRRQLLDAPRALISGLCGPFRWNRVSFLENLRAAAQSGDGWRAVGTLCLFGTLALVIILWAMALAGVAPAGAAVAHGFVARLRVAAARNATLAAATAAVVATIAILSVAHGLGSERVIRAAGSLPLHLPSSRVATLLVGPPGEESGPAGPTAVAARLPTRPPEGSPKHLDLVSFLHNGETRRQGETVAWLRALGPGCGDAAFPVRAGIETAETAPGRFEIDGAMRHEMPPPLQSWWQDDRSARHYWGHAYLASWSLPAACEPQRIVLNAGSGAGELEVRSLVVAAAEPRP